MISRSEVQSAAKRIEPHCHITPIMTSTSIDQLAGCRVYFKCDHLQKAGAFKSRGAVNAVFSCSQQEIRYGVCTHSSGNHGAALARAARLRQVPAFIVVPQAANPLKMEAIEQYGGQLVICDNSLEARSSKLEEIRLQTRAREIPPYDDPLVIAGQGTAALELIDQVADLDSILVPVGGGGLLAGAVLAANSTIKVYGAEPDQADDAHRSFHTGTRVLSHQPNTLCDGLLTTLGELNFEIISAGAENILLVSEAQIIESMEFIWRYLKQLVEPSSAVVLAAIIAHRDLFTDQKIGVVLTGGNVDYRNLPFAALLPG